MICLKTFPSPFLEKIFILTEAVFRPYLWCFDQLVSPFLPTDPERLHPIKLFVKRLITPVYLVLFAILTCPAAVAFILRCLVLPFRQPYCLSVQKSGIQNENIKKNREDDWKKYSTYFSPCQFGIVSSNVCLLPDCLSRMNNLGDTKQRARYVGERIVIDQLHYREMTSKVIESKGVTSVKDDLTFDIDCPGMSHDIITHFPHIDFLCLQECWYDEYNKVLISELHKEFPWIVHDVRKTGLLTNFFMFNSGLLFASRYKIMDVDFKHFNKSCKQCIFNSKGLLMVKVLLYQNENLTYVGYVFNTHLQAYQGDSHILDKQMDDIVKWSEEFKKQTANKNEVAHFDILCGDFNFDNLSPGEKMFREHNLFNAYRDVCRLRPGKDKHWTIGTEMRQGYMWETEVLTAEGLRDMLKDPYLRQRYIVDATVEKATMKNICQSHPKQDEDGNYKTFPEGGKRRIDYILYRDACPLNVKSFNFVTRLATLTDHIPLSMTFTSKVY